MTAIMFVMKMMMVVVMVVKNDDVDDDVDLAAEDNCDAYESIANIQPARYVMQDLPSAYNYNCHIVNNSILHTFS